MQTWTQFRDTAYIRIFSFLKIPLLGWARPSVLEMSETRTVLKIPLGRRTKNHLGSMYFGALSMGGEAAVAIPAVIAIQKCGHKVDFLFKDFQAEFHKRADGDVHFICEQGKEVRELVKKAIESKERENLSFKSFAIVPSKDPNLKVAEFSVTMTVKLRQKKIH